MALAAGTLIGSYEVVELLGAGGMGEVYRARDRKLNRDVALKVLLDSGDAGHERVARFSREAQTLAALNHPHIAQVYGVEEHAEAGPCIAMELVPGRTLAEMMAGGPLPINEALQIARQMADALEAAHEAGLVHRDLKPANVKVRDDGTVKVLDFGLAKTASAASPAVTIDPTSSPTIAAPLAAITHISPAMGSPVSSSPVMTQDGVIMGTPAYMSPEQAKGRPIDKRADIWAFGAILFEMLTGKGAFHAEDISETLAAVLTRQLDLAELPANTPLRLRALVRRCLNRDPRQRLRDIGDARLVIDDILAGLPEHEPAAASAATPPAGWQRYAPWGVAAAAIVAATVMGLRSASAPTAEAPRVVTRSSASIGVLSGFVALSPDGKMLAYTSAGGSRGFHIALRPLDRLEAQAITGTDDGRFPVFSPDGQSIAFTLGPGGIRRVPVTGGDVMEVSDGDFTNGGAWGTDNTIVFSGKTGLMRVSANGGKPEAITTLGKDDVAHNRPQFLPGNRILFTVRKGGSAPPQFAIVDGTSHRTLVNGGDNGRYVASGLGANIGHLVYGRDNTLFALPFDLDRLEAAGAEAPVIERVSSVGPQWLADYAVSNNGLLVFSREAEWSDLALALIDRTGKADVLPTDTRLVAPRLSPDGKSAVGVILDQTNRADVYALDLARGTTTRLSFAGENYSPIWGPGGRVVFAADVDGKHGIYVAEPDGSTKPTLLFSTASRAVPLSVSPDIQHLLFFEKQQIFVYTRGATEPPRPLHASPPGREAGAQLSPDGQWVAYTSDESGRSEAYVHAFPDGRRERVSLNGAQYVRWTRNGRELIFWNTLSTGNFEISSVTVRTEPALQLGTPEVLFAMASAQVISDFSPDGSRAIGRIAKSGAPTTFVTVTDWFEELRQKAPLASR